MATNTLENISDFDTVVVCCCPLNPGILLFSEDKIFIVESTFIPETLDHILYLERIDAIELVESKDFYCKFEIK